MNSNYNEMYSMAEYRASSISYHLRQYRLAYESGNERLAIHEVKVLSKLATNLMRSCEEVKNGVAQ